MNGLVAPMAIATPYDTGRDILAYVLRKAGEVLPTTAAGAAVIDSADFLIDAKRYIDQAQLDIVGLRPWSWARTSIQVLIPSVVEVQVVRIQNQQVTLARPPDPPLSYEWLQFEREPTQYLITGGAGTQWNLSIPYFGTSTSGAGLMWRSTIQLPENYLGFPWIFDTDYARWTPLRPLTDFGTSVTDPWSRRHVRFYRKDQIMMIPRSRERRSILISFNQQPQALTFDGSAADLPLIPQQFRQVIGDRAVERLYGDKRDARVPAVSAEVRDTLSRMIAQEVAESRPRLWVPAGHRVAG